MPKKDRNNEVRDELTKIGDRLVDQCMDHCKDAAQDFASLLINKAFEKLSDILFG